MTGISEQYFGFVAAAEHRGDCRLFGTNVWEVTRTPYRGDDSLTIRMLCRECGVVRVETGHSTASECTTVDLIGYGAKPQRAAGLWLHPGPFFDWQDDRGPQAYYVTGSSDTPAQPEDVIGAVGWKIGRRGGTKWWAAHGLKRGEYSTYVDRDAPHEFASRTAAVKWVAAQHAQALAEVPR